MDTEKIFDSSFTYQSIAFNDSRTDSIPHDPGGSTTITINHGLGYIPSFRVWYEPANLRRFPVGRAILNDGISSTTENNNVSPNFVYATTSSLVVEYNNSSGSSKNVTTYYRIYYEEQD